MFSKTLYVQVRENQFQVRNVIDGRSVQQHAKMVFSHPRMLIGDFTVAEMALSAVLSEAKGSCFVLKTNVLIHPLENIAGGLTQVEERVLLELAKMAGASKVILWTGELLSDQEVLAKFSG